jgi:hypothetical protein
MVYVRLVPTPTGSGESTLVTDTSATDVVVVVSVSLSLPMFGSGVADATVAVLVRMPAPRAGLTATTSVKKSDVTPKLGFEQETIPAAPTAGVVQDQLPVVESDTNVAAPDSRSVKVALAALFGPLLVMVIW